MLISPISKTGLRLQNYNQKLIFLFLHIVWVWNILKAFFYALSMHVEIAYVPLVGKIKAKYWNVVYLQLLNI